MIWSRLRRFFVRCSLLRAGCKSIRSVGCNLNGLVIVITLPLVGCGRDLDVPVPPSQARKPQETDGKEADGKIVSADIQEPSSPPVDPLKLQDDAIDALDSGDLDAAFRSVRALKSVAPDDPEVIFLMARVLAERNRFAEAIKMLDDLAATTPEARLPTLGQTAEWLVFQGHWQEAEERYRTLLGEVSDPSMVERMLAQLLLRQGRRLEAADYLHELCRVGNIDESELRSLLISLHPFAGEEASDESAPIGPLGRARYQIGQGDWDAAMGELEQLRSRRPIESALRGRILAHQQDYESLGKWAADAPASAEEFADYWFAMGAYEAHRGNHRAAVRSFCSAVLDDQTDAAAYRRMSESLVELDAAAEAQEASNRARLIEQTQLIGERLTDNSDPDILAMSKLSDLLEQLQRPLEALAWRAVKTVYSQSLSEQGVMEELREINRIRMQRLEAGDFEASEQFILCGIDLGSLRRTD